MKMKVTFSENTTNVGTEFAEDTKQIRTNFGKVHEVGGATPDAVLYAPQTLTDEKKAQARKNIGAVDVGTANSIVGGAIDEYIDPIWDSFEQVVHHTPQDLTEEQKAQALENIGAMPATGLVTLKLLPEDFEVGSVWCADYNNGKLTYDNNASECVRTKSNSVGTFLKKGDRILCESGVDFRVQYKFDITQANPYGYVYSNASNKYITSFTMPMDAECHFSIRYTDKHVGELTDLVQSVIIERDYFREEVPVPEINNEAKGVFGIMTYNAGGWYNGSGYGGNAPAAKTQDFIELQKGIIDRYKPDVLCLQEYSNLFASTNMADNILSSRYHFIEFARETSAYDGKAICTNRSLDGAENVLFTATDGCVRNYEKAYVYMNGRKVCVISTHFALTSELITAETEELIAAVANEEYFIICMDANVDATNQSADLYINSLKRFADLGYKMANGGEHGVFKTYASTNIAIDNIITSANINIKSVVMDTQKEGIEDGSDHYPLIAYVEVF